jgi:hypothetical protein
LSSWSSFAARFCHPAFAARFRCLAFGAFTTPTNC